jgi:hypothetical protein
MTTTNSGISEDKIKSFDNDKNYVYCDVCEFNGYPNEKVVYYYEGLRSEEEEGFITKFTVYDYPTLFSHVHKHNRKLSKFVNLDIDEEIGVKSSR